MGMYCGGYVLLFVIVTGKMGSFRIFVFKWSQGARSSGILGPLLVVCVACGGARARRSRGHLAGKRWVGCV